MADSHADLSQFSTLRAQLESLTCSSAVLTEQCNEYKRTLQESTRRSVSARAQQSKVLKLTADLKSVVQDLNSTRDAHQQCQESEICCQDITAQRLQQARAKSVDEVRQFELDCSTHQSEFCRISICNRAFADIQRLQAQQQRSESLEKRRAEHIAQLELAASRCMRLNDEQASASNTLNGTRSLLDRKKTRLRDVARELEFLQLECGQTFSKQNLDMALAEVELKQKEHLGRIEVLKLEEVNQRLEAERLNGELLKKEHDLARWKVALNALNSDAKSNRFEDQPTEPHGVQFVKTPAPTTQRANSPRIRPLDDISHSPAETPPEDVSYADAVEEPSSPCSQTHPDLQTKAWQQPPGFQPLQMAPQGTQLTHKSQVMSTSNILENNQPPMIAIPGRCGPAEANKRLLALSTPSRVVGEHALSQKNRTWEFAHVKAVRDQPRPHQEPQQGCLQGRPRAGKFIAGPMMPVQTQGGMHQPKNWTSNTTVNKIVNVQQGLANRSTKQPFPPSSASLDVLFANQRADQTWAAGSGGVAQAASYQLPNAGIRKSPALLAKGRLTNGTCEASSEAEEEESTAEDEPEITVQAKVNQRRGSSKSGGRSRGQVTKRSERATKSVRGRKQQQKRKATVDFFGGVHH